MHVLFCNDTNWQNQFRRRLIAAAFCFVDGNLFLQVSHTFASICAYSQAQAIANLACQTLAVLTKFHNADSTTTRNARAAGISLANWRPQLGVSYMSFFYKTNSSLLCCSVYAIRLNCNAVSMKVKMSRPFRLSAVRFRTL